MAEPHEGDGRPEGAQGALRRDVHDALKSAGWAVPETEDDVRRAEAALAGEAVALPESLGDPHAVLERAPHDEADEPRVPAFPPAGEAGEDLARAARAGGEVPPQIEEIMRRDRRAAEEAFDEDEHGEDVG